MEPENARWYEQYARMARWHERFSRLSRGRIHDMESENYIDDVHAFFQNAHHLKDWIKNDHMVPQSVAAIVEQEITNTKVLQLCADICNSTKHLRLNSPRGADSVGFGGKHYDLQLGFGQEPVISLRYEFVTGGGNIEAFVLATHVLDAWTSFLERHNLLHRRSS